MPYLEFCSQNRSARKLAGNRGALSVHLARGEGVGRVRKEGEVVSSCPATTGVRVSSLELYEILDAIFDPGMETPLQKIYVFPAWK